LRLLLSRGHGACFKSAGTRRGGGGGGLPGPRRGALATASSDDEPAGAGPRNLSSDRKAAHRRGYNLAHLLMVSLGQCFLTKTKNKCRTI